MAQVFTLTHELAHLWLKDSGVSNPLISNNTNIENSKNKEIWCDSVAYEILMPLKDLNEVFDTTNNNIESEIKRLASTFALCNCFIMRRLLDAGKLPSSIASDCANYENNLVSGQDINNRKTAHEQLISRNGKLFLNAVLSNTIRGNTLHSEAFEMLDVPNISIFNKTIKKLGLI